MITKYISKNITKNSDCEHFNVISQYFLSMKKQFKRVFEDSFGFCMFEGYYSNKENPGSIIDECFNYCKAFVSDCNKHKFFIGCTFEEIVHVMNYCLLRLLQENDYCFNIKSEYKEQIDKYIKSVE